MSAPLTCLAYAKINLYLDVLNQRRDGYHNLESIFQSVSLADELRFEPRDSRLTLECAHPELPCDASNLVLQAAELFRERTGCPRGAHIVLLKRIPMAAGLAGGSADAAATLTALNRLWEIYLPVSRLLELALDIGSDVPYCLMGGAKAGRLRGQDLFSIYPPASLWYVLVHPPVKVRTRDVFTNPLMECNTQRPFAGWTRAFRSARRAFESGDMAGAVFNRLEHVVFGLHPELAEIKNRLLSAGCVAAAMSGSGPTVFGVCTSYEQAEAAARSFSDYPTSVTCPTRVGVNIPD